MTIKRLITLFLSLTLAAGLLTGCGESPAAPAAEPVSDRPLHIVTTIFPVYDWVRQLLGDDAPDAELTMLLNSGVDLHSYQPTAADILEIAACDLFIYAGGESDAWVADALRESANPDRKTLNLLALLGDAAKEEELVEGMQAEEEEEAEEEEGEIEYDEHVWLSLRNAQMLCAAIADVLAEIDPDRGDAFRANAQAYIAQLAALDEAYADMAAAAPLHTLLFGDRFPFRYLADDYDLDYYAAFAGCSAETEASFETIVFLAEKVDELGLNTILQIENADGSIARTIRDVTQTKDQQILVLDSLQSITATDVAEGVTYLSVMEQDLEVLRAALSG